MKYSLKIKEVVKKLYNNDVTKFEILDGYDCLKSIFENSDYKLVVTEIIYRITLNFIYGEITEGISQQKFPLLDVYHYVEKGTFGEKLNEVFG